MGEHGYHDVQVVVGLPHTETELRLAPSAQQSAPPDIDDHEAAPGAEHLAEVVVVEEGGYFRFIVPSHEKGAVEFRISGLDFSCAEQCHDRVDGILFRHLEPEAFEIFKSGPKPRINHSDSPSHGYGGVESHSPVVDRKPNALFLKELTWNELTIVLLDEFVPSLITGFIQIQEFAHTTLLGHGQDYGRLRKWNAICHLSRSTCIIADAKGEVSR